MFWIVLGLGAAAVAVAATQWKRVARTPVERAVLLGFVLAVVVDAVPLFIVIARRFRERGGAK